MDAELARAFCEGYRTRCLKGWAINPYVGELEKAKQWYAGYKRADDDESEAAYKEMLEQDKRAGFS